MITGLIVKPGQTPKKITINNTLEELQKLVGGYIEFIYPTNDSCLIVNEEGKILNLTPNRYYQHDILVGNILIFGIKNGDITSLTTEQFNYFKFFFGSKTFI